MDCLSSSNHDQRLIRMHSSRVHLPLRLMHMNGIRESPDIRKQSKRKWRKNEEEEEVEEDDDDERREKKKTGKLDFQTNLWILRIRTFYRYSNIDFTHRSEYTFLRSWHGSNKENEQLGPNEAKIWLSNERIHTKQKQMMKKNNKKKRKKKRQQQRNQLTRKKKEDKIRRSTHSEEEEKKSH